VQWYWWALAAIALAGAEIIVGQLVLLMLAAGALAGSAASWSGAPFVWQAIIAALVAALMLLAVRPVAIRHMQRADPNLRTGMDLIKGASGLVLEKVDGHDGRVKVNGEIWSARSYDPYVTIDVGGNISVVEVDGATVVVLPLEL
jgi:membrane protein implicated in regulation of membrane protease activity